MQLSYIIKNNKKGNFIHFKLEGHGKMINELEKNEKIDKNLLRYLTVKVKKFNLEENFFNKTTLLFGVLLLSTVLSVIALGSLICFESQICSNQSLKSINGSSTIDSSLRLYFS